jgi:hypothetical protein
MAAADFVIVPGDLLSHRFGDGGDLVRGALDGEPAQQSITQQTAAFVIHTLTNALPDKAIFIALGNNDADCGDYAIEPGGTFLAATATAVKRAAGAQVTEEFETTYRAGGYYEARHPTVQNAKILVLNDVLWSRRYQNRCGSTGFEQARKQLSWLESQLREQQARGGTVLIVHHIPWGIDAYSTLHSTADDCGSGVVAFLREDVSVELLPLLRRYAGTISASFSAHAHYDDFRLLLDDTGKPVVVEKVAPAISPIAGQNPGFIVFSYDLATGTPSDYRSYSLANLETLSSTVPGDWRVEYVFTEAYAENLYSPDSIKRVWSKFDEAGKAREIYLKQRQAVISEKDLSAYACAILYLETESYTRCHCQLP